MMGRAFIASDAGAVSWVGWAVLLVIHGDVNSISQNYEMKFAFP
jgi:hypothetical protein